MILRTNMFAVCLYLANKPVMYEMIIAMFSGILFGYLFYYDCETKTMS